MPYLKVHAFSVYIILLHLSARDFAAYFLSRDRVVSRILPCKVRREGENTENGRRGIGKRELRETLALK